MNSAKPEPVPATQALLDYATQTRPDLNRAELEQAIADCWTAGWTWGRTQTAVALMIQHGETPRDLKTAAHDPLKRRRTA